MARDFEDWLANFTDALTVDNLKGTRIAIEAADCISRLLTTPSAREPILGALGGFPYSIKHEITQFLKYLETHEITPIFVFPGLNVGQQHKNFQQTNLLAQNNQKAWKIYSENDADGAVQQFGEPLTQQRVYSTLVGASNGLELAPICPVDIFRIMQAVLTEERVDFQVAPYSALAQLAYLLQQKNIVDFIAASPKVLLYDVDKVITLLSYHATSFHFVQKQNCLDRLGGVSPEIFMDAMLLSGASELPPLPSLKPSGQEPKIKAAVSLLNSHGGKGNNVCLAFKDDPQHQSANYTDHYRRSFQAIKHHVVITSDGKVEPFALKDAPGDVHEIIGQRLPDEIYHYLHTGVISPRVLNWRTSGEIVEPSPLDGGDSEEYRSLVRDSLSPLRASTLSVLGHSLHRFYQHKDVSLHCYFDQNGTRNVGVLDAPEPKAILEGWNNGSLQFKELSGPGGAGPFGCLISSLGNETFVADSVTKRGSKDEPLESDLWVTLNTLGRVLHLRQYVDSNHRLTPWGEALKAAITALDGKEDLEQAVFLAIEVARLGHLTHKPIFQNTAGAPTRGSEEDKRNCLLISRVACFGNLRHKEIGYTGPLNRHLLSYYSFIDIVRQSLRDLAEVCLTTLLLNGDAKRDELDLTGISQSLPFATGNNCALGIAVLSHLDYRHPSESQAQDEERGIEDWFPNSFDVNADVQLAFKLWDAVYAGAQAAGTLWTDKQVWDEANEWLQKRRQGSSKA